MTENNATHSSLEVIQGLEDYILSCLKIPLTSTVLINEEQLFVLLDQLKKIMPAEIVQAEEIVKNETQILAEAQKKARECLSKTNLVKEAKLLVEKAKKEAEIQRYEADQYSEQVLADLEVKVHDALHIVKTGRETLSQNIELSHQKVVSSASN